MAGSEQQMCLVCFSVNCMEQDAHTGDMRCSVCGIVSQEFREEDGDEGGAGGPSQAVIRESNLAAHQQREDVARADAARAVQAVSLQVQAQALSEHYCTGLQRMLALQCHALSSLLFPPAPPASGGASTELRSQQHATAVALRSVARQIFVRLVLQSGALKQCFPERCWLFWRAGEGAGRHAWGEGDRDGGGGGVGGGVVGGI
ncbi:hypothetical protein CLOM_g835 [Closterium sp. NIES-68]|nr:hypothetical protein CLOM_g835 [Closterium sp. NIES-68]